MADLGEVLASIVAAVGDARRQADEQTVVMAEYYRSQPLMEGMSVPRIRLPEVTVELPIVVSSETPPRPGKVASFAAVNKALSIQVRLSANDLGVRLPQGAIGTFQGAFKEAIGVRKITVANAQETYAEAASDALLILEHEFQDKVDDRLVAALRRQLPRVAREAALARQPEPGRMDVEVVTGKVRDSAVSGVATKVHLQLREDAMEWAVFDRADGTQGEKLLPE